MKNKVLGIGNALVDMIYHMESVIPLKELSLPKGSMTLVDYDRARAIIAYFKDEKATLTTGGSASNAISAIASLGGECGFIGRTGEGDSLGTFYIDDLKNHDIEPIFTFSEISTGTAITLMSPDTERTFATFLGAASTLSAADLKPAFFDGYDILHIEGYLVQNYELMETAIAMAKKAGLKISLDLASYNIVVEHLDFLRKIFSDGIDIVFANEKEALAYTGCEELEALAILGNLVPTSIVKLGGKGSIIMDEGKLFHITAEKVKKIDSNGAGDSYAGGFLYGKSRGLSTQACGDIASMVATEVVKVVGPKLDAAKWRKMRPLVQAIEERDKQKSLPL